MRSTSRSPAMSLNRWNARSAPNALAEALAVSSCEVQTAFSSYCGRAFRAGTWALAPQPLPPWVTVAPTMPTRILSVISVSWSCTPRGSSPRCDAVAGLVQIGQVGGRGGQQRRLGDLERGGRGRVLGD